MDIKIAWVEQTRKELHKITIPILGKMQSLSKCILYWQKIQIFEYMISELLAFQITIKLL